MHTLHECPPSDVALNRPRPPPPAPAALELYLSRISVCLVTPYCARKALTLPLPPSSMRRSWSGFQASIVTDLHQGGGTVRAGTAGGRVGSVGRGAALAPPPPRLASPQKQHKSPMMLRQFR